MTVRFVVSSETLEAFQTTLQSSHNILGCHHPWRSVPCSASLAPFCDAGAMDFCCSRMHFPCDHGWEASFYVPDYHLHGFFGECLTKALAYFLIGLFVFLLLSFKSSLYILDSSLLSLFKSSLLVCEYLCFNSVSQSKHFWIHRKSLLSALSRGPLMPLVLKSGANPRVILTLLMSFIVLCFMFISPLWSVCKVCV